MRKQTFFATIPNYGKWRFSPLFIIFFCIFFCQLNAQTFSSTTSVAVPNPGTAAVAVVVSGLRTSIDTTIYGLQSVAVKITHPNLKELTLQLQSPDGNIITLSKKSPGKNYNTTFDGVATKFIDINEIKSSYTGSYTSGYRPRQDLALLNNGQNPNGTWKLLVKDDTAASTAGVVTSVTLTFSTKPAKPLLSSSSLPIVKIYTAGGMDIPNDPKVLADMYLVNNAPGVPNLVSQTNYQYQGKIGIEIRGNSTATDPRVPKKQYGFETRLEDGETSTDVSFFGMPKQSDWILSAVMSDKSLMRNVLTYQLAREMGWWASRTQYCEVIINDEYRGVFIFEEKIKRDKNRVPVEKIETTDVTYPNVSGGYIFSLDNIEQPAVTWTTKISPKFNAFQFVYPKAENVQPAQKTYLQKYVDSFETALHGPAFQDPNNGFRKFAEDSSFIDFFLISEVAKNIDAYRYSTYFYKKRGGKIVAMPVWDFDRAFRNDLKCSSYTTTDYIYKQVNGCEGRVVPWWWARLLEDAKYKQDMICRYNSLRQSTLSLQHLYAVIDSSVAVLSAGAQQRNFIRWDILGKYIPRNPSPYPPSFAAEIDTLKNWIANRLAWLDNDLGTCTKVTPPLITQTFSSTTSVAVPNPGTAAVAVVVSGLRTSIDTTIYGLQSVAVKITHPNLKELTLQLQSPDGNIITLSKKSPGKNYNTTFDGVATKFIDINEIKSSYTGSYTSGYRPRQDLALLNNGQNPNGTWKLLVKDDTAASTAGVVTSVTLTFSTKPAKPLLSSSSLPIVKIYTAGGMDIPNDPKVLADMYLVNNAPGVPNLVSQTNYQYQGKIGIEIRGNSTATDPRVPKKQYGFETRLEDGETSTDVSFFGMPKQSDWILSAVMSDKSLMRNVLTYQLAREMGWWASRTQYCEVIINDEYRGVFIFEEKIKRDKNRVPVEKIETTDVTYPNVSGGYIFSLDNIEQPAVTWTTKISPKFNAFQFVYPKAENVQPAQKTYLQKYVDSFETALHGPAFQDPNNGFRKFAEDSSFIDFFLISEVAKNIDAYRYSTYFYKKRGGKIVAMPVWDFDRAFRNDLKCSSYTTTDYIYKQVNGCEGRVVPWWWARLLEDAKYKQDMICRYNSLRQSTLSLQHLYAVIDSSVAVLSAGAQQRNFIRWDILGKYIPRNPSPYPPSFAAEIDTLKNWIANRLAWLDNDLGTCTKVGVFANNRQKLETFENNSSSVYPSPFRNHLSVGLRSEKDQQIAIRLLDVNGKTLYQKGFILQKGYQSLQLYFEDKLLSNGLYFLHIKGDNFNTVKKVVRQ